MGNVAQTAEDVVELFVGERKRIAAGDQHVADGRGAPDVGEHRLEPRIRRCELAMSNDARARAIAAIRRAEVECQKEHAVGVAMYEARYRAMTIFAEWVVGLTGSTQELAGYWNDGAPQCVVRIRRIEQSDV